MIICAFDLATETGVCDGPVGGTPRLFTWYLRDEGDTRPARLLGLRRFLVRYFESQPCDGVVYEAPMPMGVFAGKPSKGKGMIMSEANVAFARGLIGVLEMTCAEHGKEVEALRVQDARASVLGWRTNPSKTINTKQMVMRSVAQFKVEAENNNEADAYVLWAYAAALKNPRLALAHTPLFGGR